MKIKKGFETIKPIVKDIKILFLPMLLANKLLCLSLGSLINLVYFSIGKEHTLIAPGPTHKY
jgi:hypothetical protein